jgi:hypothetical protein
MIDKDEYQGYFADCYVLTNERTKQFIYSYLDNFIPNRQETADEYQFPEYTDNPTTIFKTADELIDHLEKSQNDIHTIYWSNKDKSEIRGAMCFFTNDGRLIAGLYCETKCPDTTIEERHFKALQKFCKSNIGYITYEDPAPHDTMKFLEQIEKDNK